MSTVKVSELPVLASADAADEFVVVDDSAGVTKKITQAGLADFGSNTLTAAGITFGADTLDDYEEGTWTPVTNSTSVTTVRTPRYVKIGNAVHVSVFFGAFDDSDSGEFEVSGLPFVRASSFADPAPAVWGFRFKSDASSVSGQLRTTNTLVIRRNGTTGLGDDLLNFLDSNSGILVSLTYFTS